MERKIYQSRKSSITDGVIEIPDNVYLLEEKRANGQIAHSNEPNSNSNNIESKDPTEQQMNLSGGHNSSNNTNPNNQSINTQSGVGANAIISTSNLSSTIDSSISMDGFNSRHNSGLPSLEEIKKANNKLFVGALSWNTTSNDLFLYFKKFGEVTDVDCKKDPTNNRCRGFGFISFKAPGAILDIMKIKHHKIQGKTIDPKLAIENKRSGGKIFVGGLRFNTSDDQILSYFSAYGNVKNIERPFDKVTGKQKCFAFITFEDESLIRVVLQTKYHEIDNKKCEIKEAMGSDGNFSYGNNNSQQTNSRDGGYQTNGHRHSGQNRYNNSNGPTKNGHQSQTQSLHVNGNVPSPFDSVTLPIVNMSTLSGTNLTPAQAINLKLQTQTFNQNHAPHATNPNAPAQVFNVMPQNPDPTAQLQNLVRQNSIVSLSAQIRKNSVGNRGSVSGSIGADHSHTSSDPTPDIKSMTNSQREASEHSIDLVAQEMIPISNPMNDGIGRSVSQPGPMSSASNQQNNNNHQVQVGIKSHFNPSVQSLPVVDHSLTNTQTKLLNNTVSEISNGNSVVSNSGNSGSTSEPSQNTSSSGILTNIASTGNTPATNNSMQNSVAESLAGSKNQLQQSSSISTPVKEHENMNSNLNGHNVLSNNQLAQSNTNFHQQVLDPSQQPQSTQHGAEILAARDNYLSHLTNIVSNSGNSPQQVGQVQPHVLTPSTINGHGHFNNQIPINPDGTINELALAQFHAQQAQLQAQAQQDQVQNNQHQVSLDLQMQNQMLLSQLNNNGQIPGNFPYEFPIDPNNPIIPIRRGGGETVRKNGGKTGIPVVAFGPSKNNLSLIPGPNISNLSQSQQHVQQQQLLSNFIQNQQMQAVNYLANPNLNPNQNDSVGPEASLIKDMQNIHLANDPQNPQNSAIPHNNNVQLSQSEQNLSNSNSTQQNPSTSQSGQNTPGPAAPSNLIPIQNTVNNFTINNNINQGLNNQFQQGGNLAPNGQIINNMNSLQNNLSSQTSNVNVANNIPNMPNMPNIPTNVLPQNLSTINGVQVPPGIPNVNILNNNPQMNPIPTMTAIGMNSGFVSQPNGMPILVNLANTGGRNSLPTAFGKGGLKMMPAMSNKKDLNIPRLNFQLQNLGLRLG